MTDEQLPELYACHQCRLIGPLITAVGHETVTGHRSERVSDELALGVRAMWAREGRSLIDGAEITLTENVSREEQ